jgi:hypothetical protein
MLTVTQDAQPDAGLEHVAPAIGNLFKNANHGYSPKGRIPSTGEAYWQVIFETRYTALFNYKRVYTGDARDEYQIKSNNYFSTLELAAVALRDVVKIFEAASVTLAEINLTKAKEITC